MEIHYFIGVDVSKTTLDWAVYDGKAIVFQSQSENTEAGIKACLTLIKRLPGFRASQSVCCAEHTGIYNAHLLAYLHKLSFPLWLESSLQIKKAGGLQRGKTDAIDAQRIAEYARGGVPLSLPRSDATLATTPDGDAKISRSECAPPTTYWCKATTPAAPYRTGWLYSAEEFAQGIRGHWGIENKLHWVKDVVCGEDTNRIRHKSGAVNVAVLSTIALNLHRQAGHDSITEGQLKFGTNVKELTKLIST